jgi:hypothetical protein
MWTVIDLRKDEMRATWFAIGPSPPLKTLSLTNEVALNHYEPEACISLNLRKDSNHLLHPSLQCCMRGLFELRFANIGRTRSGVNACQGRRQ